jgi:hypothetical protein
MRRSVSGNGFSAIVKRRVLLSKARFPLARMGG